MKGNAPTLVAESRERIGSRYAKRARAAGKLPAILYGHGQAPLSINLDARDTLRLIHKGEKLFKLDFAGAKGGKGESEGQVVLLKDLQFDYLGTNIVHCDFVRVDLNERVRTRVHIHLTGEAKGLKTAGAIMMHPVTEIEIECRVADIPESIELSVADLDVGGTIAAADVKLPLADMRLVTDPHAVLAHVVVQKETVTAEAAAVAADAAQPEVLTAKKPEEGAAGAKPAAGGDKKK